MKPFVRFFLLGFLALCIIVLLELLFDKLGFDPETFLWFALLFILGATAWVVWRALPRALDSGDKPEAWRKIGGFALGLILPFVLLFVVLCSIFGFPAAFFMAYMVLRVEAARHFDRPRMDHIIEQVRSQPFHGYQIFVVDSAGGIQKRKGSSLNGQINVFAERGDNGALDAQIVTFLGGHAGSWGFVYMDPPVPMQTEYGADDGRLSTPGRGPLGATYPKDRIDEHWMRAWDDVD